ncbi:hypothetical protein C8R44DRAFT_764578 [Mycena epipterygia]|nr:hypothetical protein C8R44DRAFT_764578 [Mycena epipterygia]
MSDVEVRPYKPYPWPWGQPSILAEEEPLQTNSWLNANLEEQDDASDSDYECSGSDDSDASDSEATSNDDIDASELADIMTDAASGWRYRRTPSREKVDERREDLARQVAELVKAEQDAAAAYNPDEVVSLITQFYELLIAMGHWPEGSIQYPPHTNPAVNEELAAQLGYAPAVISLMQQLPYSVSNDEDDYILGRTRFANYTDDEDLREGRHPLPYQWIPDCPDLDPWLLPLMLPNREGWNVMLDTNLGVIRACSIENSPPHDTVEWRRHGEVPNADWTEYRRTPLVPAARYLSEIIYAYRSLSRLPVINADRNDPKEKRYSTPPSWYATQEREEQDALLTLYRECGWPDQWRREEFITKWETKKKEIGGRAREAMKMDPDFQDFFESSL